MKWVKSVVVVLNKTESVGSRTCEEEDCLVGSNSVEERAIEDSTESWPGRQTFAGSLEWISPGYFKSERGVFCSV